jgi:hypothetical protein
MTLLVQRRLSLLPLLLMLAAPALHAQTSPTTSAPAPTRTTGGLALGLGGFRSNDGTSISADVMWVGDELNDGLGLRVIRQARGSDAHGYAAMLVIGGPPADSILQWMRLDFGLGYVGEQSPSSRSFARRHGVGALAGLTIAPKRFGIVRPEANAYAVVGTSAQFLGVTLGLRILDPRQLRR